MFKQFRHSPAIGVHKISGVINGEGLRANGVSFIDPNRGVLRGTIIFSELPKGFPPISFSWSILCIACGNAAVEIRNGDVQALNLRTLFKSSYDANAVIEFSNGYGVLKYTGKVREIEPSRLEVEQDWTGEYSGPTNLITYLPYDLEMAQVRLGEIKCIGTSVLITSTEEEIRSKFEVTFIATTKPVKQLPRKQILSLNPQRLISDISTNVFQVEKHISIRAI